MGIISIEIIYRLTYLHKQQSFCDGIDALWKKWTKTISCIDKKLVFNVKNTRQAQQ